MNCSPPRAMATANPAMFPAVKARNRSSWNIGSAVLISIVANKVSLINRTSIRVDGPCPAACQGPKLTWQWADPSESL